MIPRGKSVVASSPGMMRPPASRKQVLKPLPVQQAQSQESPGPGLRTRQGKAAPHSQCGQWPPAPPRGPREGQAPATLTQPISRSSQSRTGTCNPPHPSLCSVWLISARMEDSIIGPSEVRKVSIGIGRTFQKFPSGTTRKRDSSQHPHLSALDK